MKVNVIKPFAYRLGTDEHAYAEGPADMPEPMAQIATGAGWAVVADDDEPAPKPATKARKAAPENK